jgi:uncharacterized protein (TIGR02646 family)
MRRVNKGPEPSTLFEHRRDDVVSPNWDNYPGKAQARQHAVAEQRAICAFCQAELRNDPNQMKLAHVIPRKAKPEGPLLEMAWGNIVGACMGGERAGRPQVRHCDTLQGNRRISLALDPVQFINGSLTYDWDGNIKPAKDDDTLLKELNEVLGLNCGPVVRSRQKAFKELKEQLDAASDREAWRQELLVNLDPDRSGTTPLNAYADYLLFHLREGELMS